MGRRRGGGGATAVAAGPALPRSPGMKQLCCSCLLWLGVLQATFSHEKEGSRRRKLCGRYLLIEIIKLCGQTDWRQFELEDQTPLTRLAPAPHLSKKVKTFMPDQSPSSTWKGFTNPGKTLKGGRVFALRCASLRLDFSLPVSFLQGIETCT